MDVRTSFNATIFRKKTFIMNEELVHFLREWILKNNEYWYYKNDW